MAQLFVTRRPYSVVKDRCSLRRILPPSRTANLLYRGVAAFTADQLRIAPGGDSRDRTGNLRLAKPALSQLSYIPGSLVGLSGLEPLTSRLSGARSNHLSYRPPRLDSFTRRLTRLASERTAWGWARIRPSDRAPSQGALPEKRNSVRVRGDTWRRPWGLDLRYSSRT